MSTSSQSRHFVLAGWRAHFRMFGRCACQSSVQTLYMRMWVRGGLPRRLRHRPPPRSNAIMQSQFGGERESVTRSLARGNRITLATPLPQTKWRAFSSLRMERRLVTGDRGRLNPVFGTFFVSVSARTVVPCAPPFVHYPASGSRDDTAGVTGSGRMENSGADGEEWVALSEDAPCS